MPAPLYDVLLVAHVASAVLGFGSIAIGGWAASVGCRSSDPMGVEWVVRFFRPGIDWPGRVIFLVPVLGLTMLLGGDRSEVARVWPWLGLTIWSAAAGLATAMGWPAERRAQLELAAVAGDACDGADPDPRRLEAFRAACARMERAAGLVSVCFVVVVVLMVWQP
jgi:hypothetical protein